jgi:hypothetical protein
MDTPKAIRSVIIQHYQSGLYSQRQISVIIGRSRSTVEGVIHSYNRNGTSGIVNVCFIIDTYKSWRDCENNSVCLLLS